MARVDDLIAGLRCDQPYYTFELFPPKTPAGLANLVSRLERLAALKPAWFSVTWGAGGSTQARSLELASLVIKLGLPVVLHLTCTNMPTPQLDQTLAEAKRLGIRNILALRGDPPRGDEYWVAADPEFQHGADLVRYIRRKHGNDFCIGVAAYPEGHTDSADKTSDVEHLRAKVDAGADFVVTQLFYDTDRFLAWFEQCRSVGIAVPILPGVMPIQSFQTFRRMTSLCQSTVPDDILDALRPIAHDDQAVKDYGVRLAIDMMRKLRSSGVRGFHLCTLNLERSVSRILDELRWVSPLQVDSTAAAEELANGIAHQPAKANGDVRSDATSLAAVGSRRFDGPESDFPNGRFGDARSPAYGDLDGWGVSLKLSPAEALRHWGTPTSDADLSRIFAAYIRGKIPAIPWCDEPLQLESGAIMSDLLSLNSDRGWWTVGSQPAVDGAPSSSAEYGFGPSGGYVYQKAFVEFFATRAHVEAIVRQAAANGSERAVTYYAAPRSDAEFETNMADGDANAVTWGVFPGKEIATTTIIEEMSFKAWREEAFAIWSEWEHLYGAKTPARQLLRTVGEQRWLVSIVHHDYKDGRALWRFLDAVWRDCTPQPNGHV